MQGCATTIMGVLLAGGVFGSSMVWAEPLVIAGSPSLKATLEALGRAYETLHPTVSVRLHLDSGLELRRTIATFHNNQGRDAAGKGLIHVVAPGGDELLTRLEQKQYLLPGTKTAYARVPLVLIVPESLVDAPASFEDVLSNPAWRVAAVERTANDLGATTWQLLDQRGATLAGRLDLAVDAKGVIEHVLQGRADVGVVFGPEAMRASERVRVTAVLSRAPFLPTHSMAMDRDCPNRLLCDDFLRFVRSPAAQAVLSQLGYASLRDQGVAE